MTEVSRAYKSLLQLASTNGREFTHGQVFLPIAESESDPRNTQVVGTGRHFIYTVLMPSGQTSMRVVGIVDLFILCLRHGTLMLCTHLTWRSVYGEHSSYAHYVLSQTDADLLGQTHLKKSKLDPSQLESISDEELMQRAFMTLSQDHRPYNAVWIQQLPVDDSAANYGEVSAYHRRAVLTAMAAWPQLLGMLSIADGGAVQSQALIDLLDWVQTNP